MTMIIIGAIVSMLVFFFQRWWTAHHPINPVQAKQAFLDEVGHKRHFWMGHNRTKIAEKLFDKYVAKYNAAPPMTAGAVPLTEEDAGALAAHYAEGLTLTPEEIASL